MAEATDEEIHAFRIVEAIVAKGPKLLVAVSERVKVEIDRVAGPWLIKVNPRQGDYRFYREKVDPKYAVAQVFWEATRWVFETQGVFDSRGESDCPHDAMDRADAILEAANMLLLPGRPTAAPWAKVNDRKYIRKRFNGAPNEVLVEVHQTEERGSNWHWDLKKMSGVGPKGLGPWGSAMVAKQEADKALSEAGWIVL